MPDNAYQSYPKLSSILEPWRSKIGPELFDPVVAQLDARDQRLEVMLGTGRWVSYTPVLTAATTDPTLGTGAFVDGTYTRFGRTILGTARFRLGAGFTAGSGFYLISLPFTRVALGAGDPAVIIGHGYVEHNLVYYLVDAFVDGTLGTQNRFGMVLDQGAVADFVSNNSPVVWDEGDTFTIFFCYDGDAV